MAEDTPNALHEVLGRALEAEEEGDLRFAEEGYRELVDAGYPDSQAAYRLAYILADRGEYDEAARLYEKAIEQGDDEYAPMELATILGGPLDRREDAERLIEGALQRGYGRGYVNLGALRTEEGRFDEAEEALRHALDARVPYAHLHMAKLLLAKGQEKAAVDEYLRCVDDELDPGAWRTVGAGLFNLGRLSEAEQMFRRGLQAGDPRNYKDVGGILRELGRTEEARELLEEALSEDQRDVLVEYGILLRDLGEHERAERVLCEALDEGDTDAHFELAELYEKTSRMKDAEREYRAAIAANDEEAHRAYAAMLTNAGRFGDAETQLKLAIESGDKDATRELAGLYERLGRHSDARRLRESECGISRHSG